MGAGSSVAYMRDNVSTWLTWLRKQTGADGFRFDAVKHFPPEVVGEALTSAMGPDNRYFAVGEYVDGTDRLDEWTARTGERAGTWDFPLRGALAEIVAKGGFFDMGGLPNVPQKRRLKTVPFVNNHDTWRGAFFDSANNGSLAHDDNDGDPRQNRDELGPTVDPDDPRADVAYAAAFVFDGSPMVYYEDLFVNHGPDRKKADPATITARPYLVNLVWCHNQLGFKAGALKIRHQNSADLLILERSGRALVGLNDNGNAALSATVATDFGPNVRLHDYSGSTPGDRTTDAAGRVSVTVPPMSYAVWAPAGRAGATFNPVRRRTTQQFEMADDVGDVLNAPGALGYGGRLVPGAFRTAGAVWAASGTLVNITLKPAGPGAHPVELRADRPDEATGAKSRAAGPPFLRTGAATRARPLVFGFRAPREGYYLLSARLTTPDAPPAKAFIAAEYEAPLASTKF